MPVKGGRVRSREPPREPPREPEPASRDIWPEAQTLCRRVRLLFRCAASDIWTYM